jgi:RNA polymerase sigma factor (sigma-70 family)
MRTQQEQDDFLELIASNKGIILKICNAYCNNKADRQDLAQEIIFTLWKGFNTYNRDYKFSTWMYKVALNVAISFYRANKKLNTQVSLTETDLEPEDNVLTHTLEEENINILQQQILHLKEFDRALILLYFEEKSYREIAEITETNVATKISRIKEKLKQQLITSQKQSHGRY